MKKSVAVVILNWNGAGFLRQFLPSVLAAMPADGVLYVADNGSTDGSMEYLRSLPEQDGLRLICFDRNYGFTGGYNRAFAAIEASRELEFEYYLLLNSDIEVPEGWLTPLIRFMEAHPVCAVCSPKILSFSRREYFEHAGACGGFLDRWYFPYCRGRVLSRIERDEGQYDSECRVAWASGAALMVRSSAWRQLGGLDEAFFAHMEEIDFCWRAALAGWEVWVVPSSVVYHVGGGTLPNNSPNKVYLNFRNNLLMIYKNCEPRIRSRVIFTRMLVDGMIGCIYFVTFKFAFVNAVIRAHRDYRRMRSSVTVTPQKCPVRRPVRTLLGLVLRGGKYRATEIGD